MDAARCVAPVQGKKGCFRFSVRDQERLKPSWERRPCGSGDLVGAATPPRRTLPRRSALECSRPGGRSYARVGFPGPPSTLGAATLWERRPRREGRCPGAPPWNVRGRVAAPTPGPGFPGPSSTLGAATVWERRPRREGRCPGAPPWNIRGRVAAPTGPISRARAARAAGAPNANAPRGLCPGHAC